MKWNFNYEINFKSAVDFVKGEDVYVDLKITDTTIQQVIGILEQNFIKNDYYEFKDLADFLLMVNNCAEALGGKLQIEEKDTVCVNLLVEKLYVESNIKFNPAKNLLEKALKICKFIDFSVKNKKISINFVTF